MIMSPVGDVRTELEKSVHGGGLAAGDCGM
jgi:hypothetical protein